MASEPTRVREMIGSATGGVSGVWGEGFGLLPQRLRCGSAGMSHRVGGKGKTKVVVTVPQSVTATSQGIIGHA